MAIKGKLSMKEIAVLLIDNIDYDNRVKKEIDTFGSLGYKVTLIVWNAESINYNKENVNIININLGKYKNPHGKIFSFLDRIRFWYLSSKLIRKGNYKYIHCNDLDTLGILYFLGRSYHNRIIYDAHELFPEMCRANSIGYKLWNIIEAQLIHKVKTVITPEVNRSIYLKEKYKLMKLPYVINNFPKYEQIKPNNIRSKLGISQSEKILAYVGIMNPNREIEAIIEALKFLPRDYVIVLFGFVDDEKYFSTLCEFIEKLDLSNRVYFYGRISPEDIQSALANCDIGMAFYKKTNANNFFCASNKIFDYIMAGIKVIANNYPGHKMLETYRFVRLISDVNPENIAKSVLDLADDNHNIPDIIKHKFTWESLKETFCEIYK